MQTQIMRFFCRVFILCSYLGTYSIVSLMCAVTITKSMIDYNQHKLYEEFSKFPRQHENGSSMSQQLHSMNDARDVETLRNSLTITIIAIIGLIQVHYVQCTIIIYKFQLLIAMFRLEFITNYISDQIIDGFSIASAFHICVSQLYDIFGIARTNQRTTGFASLFLVCSMQNKMIVYIVFVEFIRFLYKYQQN